MSAVRKRYDDEYEQEEMLDNEYDEENEGGYSIVDMVKNKFRSLFDPGYVPEEDEAMDEEEEEERPRARKITEKPVRQAKRTRRTEYEEEERPAPRRNAKITYEDISDSDIQRYSERIGIPAKPMREERRRLVREAMDPGASERRVSSRPRTTSAPEWEDYRGNVKRMVEAAPRTAENIEEIASLLMDDYAVLINMANLKNSKVSAISYLEGVAFVLKYQFTQVGDELYVCSPRGYVVEHDFGTHNSARRANG